MYKDIFHSVKKLNNPKVDTFVDHHVLSALKIALAYFNHTQDYFKSLDLYYEQIREKFKHTLMF